MSDHIDTIYVRLLDENVDVARPISAVKVGDGIFRILGPIPEDEVWEFQPGDLVRCEMRKFEDDKHVILAIDNSPRRFTCCPFSV